ncbi:septation protein IspZ [Plesiomonas shigelloides]|uniref:septation protein IspZ n=1 Tax=Plesiomonas shigelloides TaxID=703 RepID=UPI001780BC86|nr:septation protein IspZ [Plesiomonas shigelloides]MDT1012012.1 septation protein IspZ [Plesiomonas shigelloides]QOH80123.1 septation protein IspZ [Plesiomonas shigelloides]
MVLIVIETIIFIAVYKQFGITAAALSLLIISIVRITIKYWKERVLSNAQLALFIAIVISTLLTTKYNSATFLQVKLTLIYLIFSLGLIVSDAIFKKNIMKKLFSIKDLALNEKDWFKVNIYWSVFFFLNAIANTYISIYHSEEVWVEYKAIWSTILIIIFSFATAFYLIVKSLRTKDK